MRTPKSTHGKGDIAMTLTFDEWYMKNICPILYRIAGDIDYCTFAMGDGNCPFHGLDWEPSIVVAEIVVSEILTKPLYTPDPIQGPYTGERKPQDR